MNKNNFLYQLKNFEKLFAKNLRSTNKNSVDEFFVEIAKEFISKLRKEIDFSQYKNLDTEMSFIEVDEEGQTRIWLAHKNKLESLYSNGIEIMISNEIYIDWFGQTHSHYAIVGNYLFFDRNLKDEGKWEYSEIGDAVKDLKDSLSFSTKIIDITWNGKSVAGGIWDRKRKEFGLVREIRPILFLQRLLIFWVKKKEKVFYIDWGFKNKKVKI